MYIYKHKSLDNEKYAYKDINKDNPRSEHLLQRPQETTWVLQSPKLIPLNDEVRSLDVIAEFSPG